MSLIGWAITALVPGAGIAGLVWKFGAAKVLGTARDFAKGLSPRARLAIAITLLLVAGFFVHRHFEHKALAEAYAAGAGDRDKAWKKRLDQEHAAAIAAKAKTETAQAAVSQEIGARHEQDLRDIFARAGDQRLRGPGQAAAPACVGPGGDPGLSRAAGGPKPPAAAKDAGLDGVPAGEPLAVVPWSGLTGWAADHDALRAEVEAWRTWYARQAALNAKARETAPSPDAPPK